MADLFRRSLTLREHEILSLIATGASAKEIARELQIAARTVEAHTNHLKLKTSAKNRAHLVAVAIKLGLISNPCDHELGAITDDFPLPSDTPLPANDPAGPYLKPQALQPPITDKAKP